MGFEVPVFTVREHHQPMIDGAIKYVLACIAPVRRGHGRVQIRILQRLLHIGQGHVHQTRIAI